MLLRERLKPYSRSVMAVHRCFPPNLMVLQTICQEDSDKLTQSWCEKPVEIYPRRLKAVIAAKGAYTQY